MAESGGGKVPPKTKEQLQADVSAARARLSGNVESFVRQVHPKTIANSAVNDAINLVDAEVTAAKKKVTESVSAVKDFVGPQVDNAKSFVSSSKDATAGFFKDEYGWRSDRMMMVGGLIAGVVTVLLPVVAIFTAIGRAVRAHNKAAK